MATSAPLSMVTSLDRGWVAEPPTRPLTDFPDQYLTIQDIRLRYWQAGEHGTPLLLLHGLNGCVENWRWNIGALAQQHRVYALDGPGHGLSQPDERSLDLAFMRGLVTGFMRAHGIERSHVVALSGGGLVALALALDEPRFVDRLVLVDAAGLGRGINPRMRLFSVLPPPPRRWLRQPLSKPQLRYWLLSAFFKNPASLTNPMLDDFYANIRREHTARTAANLMRWGVNLWGQKYQFSGQLRKIQAPTLIIWGKQDQMIPVRHAYRAVRRIPDARLVIFDPCGHLPTLEHPERFNAVVLDFLKR
ncbi:MAG: alpha/beta fold hydrolase [Chloroflexi bacterium]|nr:MAG: alpha/beta fold hydrolase [Chloroflexota bacterium]